LIWNPSSGYWKYPPVQLDQENSKQQKLLAWKNEVATFESMVGNVTSNYGIENVCDKTKTYKICL